MFHQLNLLSIVVQICNMYYYNKHHFKQLRLCVSRYTLRAFTVYFATLGLDFTI